jgi:hypothetical protein
MQMFVKSQPNIVMHHEKMGRGEARVLKMPPYAESQRFSHATPSRVDYPGKVGENERGIASILFRSACQSWACGAAGSALPWHGRGRRFDPDQVHHFRQADVAQLVEQPIRNRQVSGSSPLVGSISNLPDVSARCSEWRSTFEAQPRISEKFVPLPPHCRDGTEPRRWP